MGNTTLLRYLPKWSAAPPSSPAASGLKQPLTGIVPRSMSDLNGRTADVGGVVAQVTWALLQPTQSADLDTANTAAGSYVEIVNALATGLPVRVRVLCGDSSPDWAKNIYGAGSSLTICDPDNGAVTYTVPQWWQTPFLAAWADLMARLALLLESNAQIVEIASNPATTIYGEPCQRGTKNTVATTGVNTGKTNVQVYYEAGLTGCVLDGSGHPTGPDPKDAAAILWPTEIEANGRSRWQNLGWATTRYYLPFNPVQQWQVTAVSPFTFKSITDPGSWTSAAIGRTAANMRGRVILANNSLRVPLAQAGVKYPGIYQSESLQQSANGYQTATTSRLVAAYKTVRTGATSIQALVATLDVGFGNITSASDPEGLVSSPASSLRARSIELPSGWDTLLTSPQCAAYNDRAAANTTGG